MKLEDAVKLDDNQLDEIVKEVLQSKGLEDYMKNISELKGEKVKMGNPIARMLYAEYSLKVGYWLTAEEFENEIIENKKLKK